MMQNDESKKAVFEALNAELERSGKELQARVGEGSFVLSVAIDPDGNATACWLLPKECVPGAYGPLITAFRDALETLMPPPPAVQLKFKKDREEAAGPKIVLTDS